MFQVIVNTMQVLQFMKRYTDVVATEGMIGFGLEKDGELIAGAMFEGFTGKAAWGHVAGNPGRRWLNRDFMHACFDYVFNTCGLDHLFGWVPVDNAEARRFDEHLGFKPVTVLEGAGMGGCDVMIYRMDRADCRHLKVKEPAHG